MMIYLVDSIIQPSFKNCGLTDTITDEVNSSMGKTNPLVIMECSEKMSM